MNALLYKENKGRKCLQKRRKEILGWSAGSGHRPISLPPSLFQLKFISWTPAWQDHPFLSHYCPIPHAMSATGLIVLNCVIIMQWRQKQANWGQQRVYDRLSLCQNAHYINFNDKQRWTWFHFNCFHLQVMIITVISNFNVRTHILLITFFILLYSVSFFKFLLVIAVAPNFRKLETQMLSFSRWPHTHHRKEEGETCGLK